MTPIRHHNRHQGIKQGSPPPMIAVREPKQSLPLFSVIQQPSVVIPFSKHPSLFCLSNQVFKRLLIHCRIAFLVENHIVSPDSLIKRWKRLEFRPAPRRFHRCFYTRVDSETPRSHRRKDSSSRICHQTQFLQTADALFVQLRPWAVLCSRCKTLHTFSVNQLMYAVNPTKAKRFFNSIKIIKPVVIDRPSAFQFNPAFILAVSMDCKPLAEIVSIINLQYVVLHLLPRPCRFDRAQTMYPYDAVIVCSRYLPQLLQIRPDESRPALAEDAEDLRRFHPYLVIRIM